MEQDTENFNNSSESTNQLTPQSVGDSDNRNNSTDKESDTRNKDSKTGSKKAYKGKNRRVNGFKLYPGNEGFLCTRTYSLGSENETPTSSISVLKFVFRFVESKVLLSTNIKGYLSDFFNTWSSHRGLEPTENFADERVLAIESVIENSFECYAILRSMLRRINCSEIRSHSGITNLGRAFSRYVEFTKRNSPALIDLDESTYFLRTYKYGKLSKAQLEQEFIAKFQSAYLTKNAMLYLDDLFENFILLSRSRGTDVYFDGVVEDCYDIPSSSARIDYLINQNSQLLSRYPQISSVLSELGFERCFDTVVKFEYKLNRTHFQVKNDDGSISNSIYNIPFIWYSYFDGTLSKLDDVPGKIDPFYYSSVLKDEISNESWFGQTLQNAYFKMDSEASSQLNLTAATDIVQKNAYTILLILLDNNDDRIFMPGEDDGNDASTKRIESYLAEFPGGESRIYSKSYWEMVSKHTENDSTYSQYYSGAINTLFRDIYSIFKLKEEGDKGPSPNPILEDENSENQQPGPSGTATNNPLGTITAVVATAQQGWRWYNRQKRIKRVVENIAKVAYKAVKRRTNAAPNLKIDGNESQSEYNDRILSSFAKYKPNFLGSGSSIKYSLKYLIMDRANPSNLSVYNDPYITINQFAICDRFRMLRPYCNQAFVLTTNTPNEVDVIQIVVPGKTTPNITWDGNHQHQFSKIMLDNFYFSFPTMWVGEYFPPTDDEVNDLSSCLVEGVEDSITMYEDYNTVRIPQFNNYRDQVRREIIFNNFLKDYPGKLENYKNKSK